MVREIIKDKIQDMKDKLNNESPLEADIIENYNQFWKHNVETQSGINLTQIKRELFDFSFLMDQASAVYMHITNGRMSKTNYDANTVIGEADDYFEERLSEETEELENQLNEKDSEIKLLEEKILNLEQEIKKLSK